MVREIAQTFFHGIWQMLIKTDYPGLGVSIAGVMVSFFLMRLSINVFHLLTGFGVSSSDYGRASVGTDRKVKRMDKWFRGE